MNDPYKTPEASLSKDTDTDAVQDQELATRGMRFLAATIDGLIGIVLAVPFWLATGIFEMMQRGEQPPYSFTVMAVIYGFVMFIVAHGYLLSKNGQTVGKKLLGLQITDLNGNILSLSSVLGKRYLPISGVSLIPIVGNILALVDVLFIFSKDRRCLHDHIAGTKVVRL
jgi:uncharacterized RDD family membrane protein YckC